MADLVVAANALQTGETYATSFGSGTAGAALTAGMPLCLNPSTSKLEAADANGASTYMKTVVGIALHDAAQDAAIRYIERGTLILTAILTAGLIYVLSDEAGKICPSADLASGHSTVILGVAISTTVLRVNIFNSGGALA